MNAGEIIMSLGIIAFFIVFGFFGWLMKKDEAPSILEDSSHELPEDPVTP